MQPRQFLWTWKSSVPSVHFWYGPTATGIDIGPNGMSNKVITTSKYSSWDRCQGRGRGCKCEYGQARSLSTFEEYSQEMILPYITSQLETVSRVDIVWDKYLTNSLKQSIVECTVSLRRDNGCLKERLFRRTGRLSWEVMLTKMICFAIYPIAYMHAKLAERCSSAQRMKRSSPHRMTWVMSSISNHVPMRRQIRAFCSTLRIVHDNDFAYW